jgi:hemoglobin-like flavoprotein
MHGADDSPDKGLDACGCRQSGSGLQAVLEVLKFHSTDEENTMTPEQAVLVKTSWAQVTPIADQAAGLFYGKLFELDPAIRPLFKGDMVEQGKKLMKMINTAVNGLDRLDEIVPAVRQLGARHLAYGVSDEHYDTVGAALLWTLEAGLGDAFTEDTKQAWATVYGILADTMKAAAAEAA